MKIDRMLIGAFLIGILAFAPSAFGITISVGSNAGGFTENINAGDNDAVFSSTVIAANSLSNSIEGSGNLSESHSVSNTAGATAAVGVDIRQAEWYSYSYDLWPGQGSSWKASKFAQVAASEQLDVLNAKYIQAYANALNSKGYTAGVSTVVADPGNEASLTGYRNLAMASKNEAFASQTADGAFSPDGYIQADSRADFTQLKSKPLQFREDTADASIRVDSGSMEGYSDLASASAQGITASQQMDSANAEQIRTKSESASLTASLFQGLKTASAKVNTRAEGSLTGYNASAESSKDYAQADQTGHIIGTFTSTAVGGKVSKTRTSNYGDEYHFDMHARKDASGSYATGSLDYYVDNVSPVANRIQGAVDASESGDTINVAGGTYYENVQIDKSLSIKGNVGSDPSAETVVDGQKSGSVFTIGKDDPHIEVSLQNVIIQNGSGTYMEMWPDYPPVQFGGGVWNQGTLSILSSQVSGNTAGYGSGIWTTGNLTVESSSIEGNGKPLDGGGIWNSGNLIVDRSIITGNEAYWNGGGIWNSGNMRVERSNVSGNTAYDSGGGIANDMGQATVVDSTISANNAAGGGGGIYNIFGTVYFENTGISWNNGNDGGGILNNGGMNVDGGFVSNNNAANGGGIFNMGTMELSDASVDNNTAISIGGGVYNSGGALNLNGGSIYHNAVYYGGGGGIAIIGGLVNLNGESVSDNTAEMGGGIMSYQGTVNLNGDSSVSHNTADYGGGIYSDNYGTVNLNHNSSVSNNAANRGGGIYSSKHGTVNLNHNSYVSDNTADYGGGIHSYEYGTVNLDDSSYVSGNIAQTGGGIYSSMSWVNLNHNSSVSNNKATSGGGIYIDWNSALNLNHNSSVSNNTAAYDGGGIYNHWYSAVNLNDDSSVSYNIAAYTGGGIYNYEYGTLNLNDNSYVSHNKADSGSGIFSHAESTVNLNHNSSVSDNTAIKLGGGIYSVVNSTVNLNDNSYISYNKAERGGGIFNDYYCMVNLNHGSIDHNNATSSPPSGGGIFNNFGTITGDTSIVHNNTPDQIVYNVDWFPEV